MNSNFLDREGLEKANLEQNFLFGGFFGLNFLRKWRVGVLRAKATKLTNCPVEQEDNGDEKDFQNVGFVGSFTKGIPHNDNTGQILDSEQFRLFRIATHTGDFFSEPQPNLGRDPASTPRWRAVREDISIRGWESPSAGLTFEIHGPDSHSVTMPPAPKLGSEELSLEMAEVYWLALLRDVHFDQFQAGSSDPQMANAIAYLNALPSQGDGRRKRRLNSSNQLDAQNIFRGATDGDLIGPYLSQFLLIGSPGHENNQNNVTNGLIGYGTLKINQKSVPAQSELDHMTTWNVFLDVQDATNLGGEDNFRPPEESSSFLTERFITYPRDLATYVHFDALYEAYLNACLILLGFNAPVDPGISQLNNIFSPRAMELRDGNIGRVTGFALFGGPHILNLVTEVSTRALKAVRYQKFNIHCRLRPEALAGWMEAIRKDTSSPIRDIPQLMAMYDALLINPVGGVDLFNQLITHNREQNTPAKFSERPYVVNADLNEENVLLPMAFPEGSPMHPAYGAGHATVAGACVTILKAFFDTSAVIGRDGSGNVKITSRKEYDDNGYQPVAFVPDSSGMSLTDIHSINPLANPLTVGDELNKIAANISIGRNMAGVHYYSDYIDSLVMGEKIALGVLLEQSLAYEIYPEAVLPSFSLTAFLKDDMGGDRQIEISQGKITVNGQEVDWCDL